MAVGVSRKVGNCPINHSRITGDGKQVHRKRIDLTGTEAFGKQTLKTLLNLSGKTWVRLEAWDVVANGVISQPVWLE